MTPINTYKAIKGTQNRFERIPVSIFPTSTHASEAVAQEIAQLIRAKQAQNQPAVLGLATGSTPKDVYRELVRMHREEGLSFQNVITFNLDEYFPMEPEALQSYVYFMQEHLFNHVDIKPENYYIPDGTLDQGDIAAYCERYEQQIEDFGGLDIQLLGIGGTGHIGFNEPGSSLDSKTRLITLDEHTRIAAASDFFSLNKVPRKAITMGISTIFKAKRILLMAWGERKAPVITKAVEGPVSDRIPASYLQQHPNTVVVLDEGGAASLTRNHSPWLLEDSEWSETLIRKAVVSVARQLGKPILKLTDSEYNDNGLSNLLAQYGSAYEINIMVFNQLQHTITGWPGGKPDADDTNRPERQKPFPKRVLIFSPHPDDDIISMGGTFIRLVDQGHEVHVAYQTSGNIAVADDEALRFADFVKDFNQHFGIDNTRASELFGETKSFLQQKETGQTDLASIRSIKGMIRRGEARATCRFVGIPDENAHFLDLPFYETGKVEKSPLGREDIEIIKNIISDIKPHQIYAAGDLADPHGTHKVCLDGIFAALEELKSEPWIKDCWVWLYRGAWQEWDVSEIEMAVPMSPDEVMRKRLGIFKHQSQKDGVVFQGSDRREFWQRAEERNRETALVYDQLGFAEYEAIEAFVRYRFLPES